MRPWASYRANTCWKVLTELWVGAAALYRHTARSAGGWCASAPEAVVRLLALLYL